MDTESKDIPLATPSSLKTTPQEYDPDKLQPFPWSATNRRYLITWQGVLTMDSDQLISAGFGSSSTEGAASAIQGLSLTDELGLYPSTSGWKAKTIKDTGDIPEVKLNHEFGFALLKMDDPVLQRINEHKPVDLDTFVDKFMDKRVCFDAVWEDSKWKVLRLELQASGNGSSEHLPQRSSQELLSEKLCSHGEKIRPGTWCNGTITSIPFHDLAIASVGDLPVCVPLTSLVTDVVVGTVWSPVDVFVQEGSVVAMKISQNDNGLISAEECWGTTDVSKGEKVDTEPYGTKWGPYTDISTGVLKRNGPDFFVNVEHLSLPFPREKIFLDGKVATDDQLIDSLDSPVLCTYQPEKVIQAWIGSIEPWEVLKDKLVVPEDLVALGKNYEAVIEEFPFPDHIICRIGVIPVLFLLTEYSAYGSEAKRGDAMMVTVEVQKDVEGGCILFARGSFSPQIDIPLRRFLNYTGRVASVDDSFCTLRTDDDAQDVLFEWSAVKPYRTPVTDLANYFKRVREIIKVGTDVHFNAIYPHDSPKPYCVEVFVDVEP